MKKFLVFIVSILFLTGCGLFTENIKDCSTGFHEDNGICIEDMHQAGSFTSGDEIVDLFKEFKATSSLVNNFWGRMFTDDMILEAVDPSSPTDANDSAEKGSDDYSETNNQVEGVDEMDNVLTDGMHIYIQNYNKIQIVKAYTEALEYDALSLVKEIDIDSLKEDTDDYIYFNGMYVDEDNLIIVGTSYYYTCQESTKDVTEPQDIGSDGTTDEDVNNCYWGEHHSTTRVFVYSKGDFVLQDQFELSGSFIGSRKIGDNVYFVTNEYIPFYLTEYEDREFSIDNYLPSYSVNGTEVGLTYEDVLYMEGTEPNNFTTFYGLNLATDEISTEVVLGEGGYNLYVSTENIYLTGTKWNWNWAMIDVLEDGEDEELEEDPYEIKTSILKIAINDGIVDYEASTEVDGNALDQFAMDEHNGYLRIVTTTNNWWWWGGNNDINNRLIILDENLDHVSTLEGLGKEGESVQSTRFVGDYAYVVTFLRTDPFYVLDLSDPENPVKLSELEIPGFSDYLQPVGEDYILGIGYGDNDGGTQGIKISLYDVSDKTNAIVASEIIYAYGDNSYMWTSALYNHKDLLVSISKGIIVMPYSQTSWSNDSSYGWRYHSGALVLNLDMENGLISERGRIEHSEHSYYDTNVYKAKYIADYLYTISGKYVKVSSIIDPSTELNSLQIGESRDVYYGGIEPAVED